MSRKLLIINFAIRLSDKGFGFLIATFAENLFDSGTLMLCMQEHSLTDPQLT